MIRGHDQRKVFVKVTSTLDYANLILFVNLFAALLIRGKLEE